MTLLQWRGVPDPASACAFELDVSRVRDAARRQMAAGPVSDGYLSDRDHVIDVLNQVVATAIVCYLRHSQNAITASGIGRPRVAAEFRRHAGEEFQHAVWAAERIGQLGGTADFNPAHLADRADTTDESAGSTDLERMLRDNLVAERIVITTYQEIIGWLAYDDPTTRALIERILVEEESHADDLVDLLGL